jgi:hypothetical protein
LPLAERDYRRAGAFISPASSQIRRADAVQGSGGRDRWPTRRPRAEGALRWD